MNGKAYVNEIRSIDRELKILNSRIKSLRLQKKASQGHLYKYMKNRNLEEFEKIKLKSITPKPPTPRKPLKKKKEDALELFRDVGIPDPDGFWRDFQSTQKIITDVYN